MKPLGFVVALVLTCIVGAAAAETAKAPEWHMKATIIEACSCPMFCPCYFNDHPAEHHHGGKEGHFCRFNDALPVGLLTGPSGR